MREEIAHVWVPILADTYALYLKTQNYHWHVTGPSFISLHQLFETQYRELVAAVDEIAERIRMLGHHVPATFTDFQRLKTIGDGKDDVNAEQMLTELVHDHGHILKNLDQAIQLAQNAHDEASVALLAERITAHEKMRWILSASCD